MLSLLLPVMTCSESGMWSSEAACQNGSYTRLLYGLSSGGEPQIMAPRIPLAWVRSNSSTPASMSSSEIRPMPYSRLGACAQNSATQSLYDRKQARCRSASGRPNSGMPSVVYSTSASTPSIS